MYKLRKITISLLLVMVMLMAFCVPAIAADTLAGTSVDTPIVTIDENSTNVDAEEESNIEIPIITVDENSSNVDAEKESNIEIPIIPVDQNSSKENISPSAIITNVDGYIIRTGNSTTCQFYLHWVSTGATWNAFRWDQLRVESISNLPKITYATIGSNMVKQTAGTVGTVYVQDITIPTNVTQVRLKSTGLQGYRLTPTPAGWYSFIELNDTPTIN